MYLAACSGKPPCPAAPRFHAIVSMNNSSVLQFFASSSPVKSPSLSSQNQCGQMSMCVCAYTYIRSMLVLSRNLIYVFKSTTRHCVSIPISHWLKSHYQHRLDDFQLP